MQCYGAALMMSIVGAWAWLEEMAEMMLLRGSNCILQEILSDSHESLRILEANEHGTSVSLTVQQQQLHGMGAGTGVVKHC